MKKTPSGAFAWFGLSRVGSEPALGGDRDLARLGKNAGHCKTPRVREVRETEFYASKRAVGDPTMVSFTRTLQ